MNSITQRKTEMDGIGNNGCQTMILFIREEGKNGY
jgi:hypothetical protein